MNFRHGLFVILLCEALCHNSKEVFLFLGTAIGLYLKPSIKQKR